MTTLGAAGLPIRFEQSQTSFDFAVTPYDILGPDPGPSSQYTLPTPVECVYALHQSVTLDPAYSYKRLPRQGGSRYARLTREASPTRSTYVEVWIREPQGQERRYFVPRRLLLTFPKPPSKSELVHSYLRQRLLRIGLYPGSMYPLPRGTSALRGRVVSKAKGEPVPWVRIDAISGSAKPSSPPEYWAGHFLGFAHADERGEFLLVLRPVPNHSLVPPHTKLSFTLTLGKPLTGAVTTGEARTPPLEKITCKTDFSNPAVNDLQWSSAKTSRKVLGIVAPMHEITQLGPIEF